MRNITKPIRWPGVFGISLLMWFFVVLMSSWNKSPVFDEVPHIGAGLTYWAYGDFRMNPEHPPLVKALSVLPVMLLNDVPVVFETSEFHVKSWFESNQNLYGYFLLFRNRVNPRTVVFHARLVPVAIGLLGGLLAYWWGRRLGRSAAAGGAAGMLLLLYPEYAGHARYVTLDVPTLVGCAAISAAALTWWRRPDARRALVFAAVAAAGSLVKLPVTVFCVFTMLTLGGLSLAARRRIGMGRFGMVVLITLLAGYFAAWAAAGFRFQLTNPDLEIAARSSYTPADGNYGDGMFAALLETAWKFRLLPETSLATLAHVQSFDMRNYYFMGEWRLKGWYSYFFVTFLLKTSLVMVGVYAAAIITWMWQVWRMCGTRRSVELAPICLLVVPFLLLFGLFVVGRASLGHRYVLFIYFPLSVLAGTAMVRWWWQSQVGRVLSVMVLAYGAMVFARQYPHYATYFNEVIRTPDRALRYVADSNVDWGQDFPLMGEELRRRGIREVNLAVFGAGRPSAYGINSYRWILPGYPFATFHTGESFPADPHLYTAMSLHAYLSAVRVLPGWIGREPIWFENSVMLFAPEN